MKTRMSQIIIYVSDMQRSSTFYRDILGLRMLSESPEWSEFATGQFHLALRQSNSKDEVQGERVVTAGNAELVFEVTDIEQACAEIRQKGGPVDGPQLVEGLNVRVAFLRDPDGMAIQLIEAASKTP